MLEAGNEKIERRYRLQAQGYDFDKPVHRAAELFEMEPKEILVSGKQPQRLKARRLLCYWAVKELGMNGTSVAKKLGITQPAVSKAIQRAEKLLLANHLDLENNRML